LPLPPYSPELNPIEKVWANIKRHLRKVMSGCLSFEQALLGIFCFV
ncbi:transposase, partial [Neisseria mucosa]